MSDGPSYLVLPVSTLKANASTVFDSLAAGRTVYVAKRGEVVAAFRPYEAVPEGVAAVYASPAAVSAIELTARQLGREVPSTEVSEAANGLASLVTKNGRIYGVLTSATTPPPVTVPDPEAAGALAEAVRSFQEEHPDASLDEVVEMMANWSPSSAATVTDSPYAEDADARVGTSPNLGMDLARWRDRGSRVEDLVHAFFSRVAAVVQPGFGALAPGAAAVVAPAMFKVLYNTAYGNPMAIVREGERSETSGDVVGARTSYVAAVYGPPNPSVGAMWRLADLARREGNADEASTWYGIALDWDSIQTRSTAEQVTVLPPVQIAEC
jgi:antitoxin (DNA-binding transcriptional repressor) of toxin-antitoxin stability system